MQNDLISRSALLESFRKCYSGHLGMENSDSLMMFRSICKIINAQPIAYDVENVVEQLKNEEDCPNCSMHCIDANMCGFDEMRKLAVNIVRDGGIE